MEIFLQIMLLGLITIIILGGVLTGLAKISQDSEEIVEYIFNNAIAFWMVTLILGYIIYLITL